jgi:hypothetical protein
VSELVASCACCAETWVARACCSAAARDLLVEILGAARVLVLPPRAGRAHRVVLCRACSIEVRANTVIA